MKKVNIKDIEEAVGIVGQVVQKTQVSMSGFLSEQLQTRCYLKHENEQRTGSFKVRGAYNKIKSLSETELKKGIIASSAGNHAQGVAFAAQQAGAKAHIVMPENSPLIKIQGTQSYGAEVILKGRYYDESFAHAQELEKQKGYVFVHPYQDPKVIAGQGTIGLEIMSDIEKLDSILVPIGGGGLISGVATAIKHLNPKCKVFGVVSENAPGMNNLFHKSESLKGRSDLSTLADGIAVKSPSPYMYETYIHPLVDDIVAVSDDEIAESIVVFLEKAKTVVEGSAATTLAAAKRFKKYLGDNTCLLLCGGNIDLNLVAKIIERGLSLKGRLARISVKVNDKPGILQALTTEIARMNANILEVHHDRVAYGLRVREARIEFLLEVRDHHHIAEIKESLIEITQRPAQ